MHVLFFREDGSEQMSRQFTSPGRSYYGQDYADTDHVYTEGDVIEFHMGHSVMRKYTVVASDGKTAFVQPLR